MKNAQEIEDKLRYLADNPPEEMSPDGLIMAGLGVILQRLDPGRLEDVVVGGQDMFQDVVDFHQKFEVDYAGPPRHLPPDLSLFRLKFIEEEHMELLTAPDDNKRLDACCDLVYVILGYARLRGWDFREAWRRVHAANMAKVLSSPENPSGRETTHETDIAKPPGWTPPDHSDLVAIEDDDSYIAPAVAQADAQSDAGERSVA